MKRLILRLTHRLWNKQISRILCRAYEDRVIDSKQMHILASAFDPTQDHHVYGVRSQRGFRNMAACVVLLLFATSVKSAEYLPVPSAADCAALALLDVLDAIESQPVASTHQTTVVQSPVPMTTIWQQTCEGGVCRWEQVQVPATSAAAIESTKMQSAYRGPVRRVFRAGPIRRLFRGVCLGCR